MALKGDLSAVGLADVFQMLAMSQKVGTLIVQDKTSKKCIYVAGNAIRMLSTGERKGMRLGDLLVLEGRITEAQLEECLTAQKESGQRLGEVLVAKALVTEDDIRGIVTRQIEEEIYDLFLWKDATFEFLEGDAPPELAEGDPMVTALQFDVNGLLMEALRRVDEWGRINAAIPSTSAVYQWATPEVQEQAATSPEAALQWLGKTLDGAHSVKDLCGRSTLGHFNVCRVIMERVGEGHLLEVAPEEVASKAGMARHAGLKADAIRLYRAACGRAGDEAKTEWLQAYAALMADEDRKEGGTLFIRLAQRVKAEGSPEELAQTLKQAVEARPDDRAVREELFDVLCGLKRKEEALPQAETLIQQSMAAGDVDGALTVANKLRQLDARSFEARVLLLRVLHAKGSAREAAEELRLLQRDLKPWEAAHQAIEREMREKFPDFFKAMTEGSLPLPKKGRGGLVAACVIGALVLGGGFGVWYVFLRPEPIINGNGNGNHGNGNGNHNGNGTNGDGPVSHAAEYVRTITDALRDGDITAAGQALELLRAEAEQSIGSAAGDLAVWRPRVTREREAADLRGAIDEAVTANDVPLAAQIVQRLATDYPETFASQGLRTPVLIETDPPGAEIHQGSQPLEGRTPCVQWLSRTGSLTLRFARSGYEPVEVTSFEADRYQGYLMVTLTTRLTGWTVILGGVTGTCVPAGEGRVAVPLESGAVFVDISGRRGIPGDRVGRGGPERGVLIASQGVLVFNEAAQALVGVPLDAPAGERFRIVAAEGEPLYGPALSEDGGHVWVAFGRVLQMIRLADGQPVAAGAAPDDILAGPFSAGGRVFVFCRDARLYGWDRVDQAPVVSTELPGTVSPTGPPLAVGEVTVFALQNGMVVGLDRTGGVAWQLNLGGGVDHGLLEYDGFLYVAAKDRKIYAIRSNGRLAGQGDLGGDPAGRPVLADGSLVVADSSRVVRGFRPRELTLLWTCALDDPPVGAATGLDGLVLVPQGRRISALLRE